MGLRIPSADKQQMVKIIKENLEKKDEQIAELMRAAKLTSPSGKQIDNKFVSNLRNSIGIKKRGHSRPARESRTRPGKSLASSNQDGRALLDLVIGSDLTKDRKLRIIENLL